MSKQRRTARNSSRRVLKLAALGSAGLGLACGTKAATTITFEGFAGNNTQIATIPGYGDAVSAASADYQVTAGFGGVFGTPNIDLDWIGMSWDTYTGWDSRGSVAQSDFNADKMLSIQFSPAAAFAVQLMTFELDEWAGGGAGNITWSVAGPASGVLATGTWDMTDAGGRTLISPGAVGRIGEVLTLSLQLNTGAPSYFALDNLTFAQVPEPSALGLGVAGAVVAIGAAAMRRRRV
jgi:hypothetical protein